MSRFATKEATLNYAQRFSHAKEFYIEHKGLIFSKLGIGTFSPEPYKEENYLFHYIEAIKCAVANGINLIDTASNYRYGVSEQEIGRAFVEMGDAFCREELIICSKGGFIQLEYPFPANPYEWIEHNIIASKLAVKEDIELDQHCMTPDFLEWSCRKSLANVGIESFDIYYLHNPEMQKMRLGETGFYEAIAKAFARFEKLADEGLFASYGVAVWNAFITNSEEHISLERLVKIAQEVGGAHHRFGYIQLPFNMAKTAPFTQLTQSVEGEACTTIQAAHRLGIGVIGSSSLLQKKLFAKSFSHAVGALLDDTMTLTKDVQLALQFVRSTEGIVSSLFGSVVPIHVKENAQIAQIPPTSRAKYDMLYRL